MKSNHMFAILNPNVITIDVVFPTGPKKYRYLALKENNLSVDDPVVIHNGTEFGVGIVKEVHESVKIDTTSNIRYKFIVQRVNTERYEQICENQEKMEEKFNELEAARVATEAVKAYAEQTGMDVEAITKIASEITHQLENKKDGNSSND